MTGEYKVIKSMTKIKSSYPCDLTALQAPLGEGEWSHTPVCLADSGQKS